MKAAVLGHPIAHSLSPVLHRAAYAALGLTGWTYDAVDTTADGLQARVDALRDLDSTGERVWAGLSLTMPLKLHVAAMIDSVDQVAAGTGAVNTVVVRDGGARLDGYNTDVAGIIAALQEGGLAAPVTSAVIFGAGATAASAVAALGQLGCSDPLVLARDIDRIDTVTAAAARLGLTPRYDSLTAAAHAIEHANVVMSTMPAHAADWIADVIADSAEHVDGVLLDVIYEPRPTALTRAWLDAGGVAVGGERMLLHQAAEQVRLMTGQTAPVAAMDAALTAVI